MKQPKRIIKTNPNAESNKKTSKKRVLPNNKKKKRQHPQYGTSKLEEDFAKNFLDKLGIDYVYQFEASDIGRYFDYFIPNKDGSYGGLIIEIDGSYFHGDPRLYEDKDLNRMQKRNKIVDEYKNRWAHLHGYPIMRIWEKDIRENPKMVLEQLKERLYIQDKNIRKKGRNLGK